MKKYLLSLSGIFATIACEAQTPSMVQDIFPGTADGRPAHFLSWHGKLYFSAQDSAFGGTEMRRYDEVSPVKWMRALVPGSGWKGTAVPGVGG